jgi:hypothetical protein
MALALVTNNNNNHDVNYLQNNCDCCGVFESSEDLLTAKIRLSTNNNNDAVLITKEQLEMLQRDLARIPQLQQSLNTKEIEVIQKDIEIDMKNILLHDKDFVIANKDNIILATTNTNNNLNNELSNNMKNLQQDSVLAVAKKGAWDIMYSATYKMSSVFGLVQKDNKK